MEQQNAELSAKLKWYEEQYRLAQHKRFGASSEKTYPDQLELNLFNEAEVPATQRGQEPEMEKVTYEHRKTSGNREEDLSKLPIETVTYQLAEGEQICALRRLAPRDEHRDTERNRHRASDRLPEGR